MRPLAVGFLRRGEAGFWEERTRRNVGKEEREGASV
ncbi:MAG: hypothetical protein JWO82_2286, partial [Akkermansiaceae bacterium]|nr:hypothetical protein [Akkermansiaceae bacterium]